MRRKISSLCRHCRRHKTCHACNNVEGKLVTACSMRDIYPFWRFVWRVKELLGLVDSGIVLSYSCGPTQERIEG